MRRLSAWLTNADATPGTRTAREHVPHRMASLPSNRSGTTIN